MDQATTAGVQDSRKAEESRSDHLGEGKSTERARLETNGCILSGAGTRKKRIPVYTVVARENRTEFTVVLTAGGILRR